MSKRSVIYLASVAMGLIFVWMFIWPRVQAVDALRKSLAQAENDLERLENASQTIQEELNYYNRLSEEELELVDLAMPSDADLVNLTLIMDRLGRESGLSVNEIDVLGEVESRRQPSSGVVTTPVSLNFSGNYDALKRFLVASENHLRVFAIDSLAIGAGDDTESDANLNFQVQGKAYFYK